MSLTQTADRQRFTVHLRPGDTTVVSWKKLVKDAAAAAAANNNNNNNQLVEPPPSTGPQDQPPPSNALPPLGGDAPENIVENGRKDELPTNRFNAVIEKIERLYKGTDSGDEEDLNDVPDDDQYDTEDSFIDDEELDEYFQVDDLATKHNGFFVNRGKLEHMNDLSDVSGQQPKKRRRRDSQKGQEGGQEALVANKHAKLKKTSVEKNTNGHSQPLPSENEQCNDDTNQSHKRMKVADTRSTLEPVLALKARKDGKSASEIEVKDAEKKTQIKSQSKQVKWVTETSDSPSRSVLQPQFLPGRQVNNVDETAQSTHLKKRNDTLDIPGTNLSASKHFTHTAKDTHMHRKDCTPVNRPKGSMLEKALRELEKAVAETKPPTYEVQDADPSQPVKKRLPVEMKQKLAKVARLAASHGKISHGKMSEDLSNRLMGMLGHLMQLRTLKRNMREMIRSGLSVKQEKQDRFLQAKKEVADMVKALVPPTDFYQKVGTSGDFQESNHDDKRATTAKYRIDKALEDKMCNLYDLYVDGLDEDAGPQSSKLYDELAELWPSGSMDSQRIKRAITRAKDRKCTYQDQNKEQEKMQRKKLLGPRSDDTGRHDSTYTSQSLSLQERVASDSRNHMLTLPHYKDGSVAGVSHSSSPSIKGSKPLKKPVHSSNSIEDGHNINIQLLKKKKRKLASESTDAHTGAGKVPLQKDGQQLAVSSTSVGKVPLQKDGPQLAVSSSGAGKLSLQKDGQQLAVSTSLTSKKSNPESLGNQRIHNSG